MKRSFFFIASIIISVYSLKAQDYSWWNQLHQWDGAKHWSEYLIMSPAYLGPHALPVPTTRKGSISTKKSFQTHVEIYGGHGDCTQSITNELFLPFEDGRVGIELSLMTVEHYSMTEKTRDQRRARDFDGEGYSVGDLYLSCYLQLLKEKKIAPALMTSFNLKTASAGNIEGARFTDTPGYYFDLSAAKSFDFKNYAADVCFYSTVGFYVWQTNKAYFQNDAYSYSFGCDFNYKYIGLSNSLDGYTGWMNNGDAPKVFRSSIKIRYNKSEPAIMYQRGIRDFPYNCLRITYKSYFDN